MVSIDKESVSNREPPLLKSGGGAVVQLFNVLRQLCLTNVGRTKLVRLSTEFWTWYQRWKRIPCLGKFGRWCSYLVGEDSLNRGYERSLTRWWWWWRQSPISHLTVVFSESSEFCHHGIVPLVVIDSGLSIGFFESLNDAPQGIRVGEVSLIAATAGLFASWLLATVSSSATVG